MDHLDVAKWLWSLDDKIDLHANNEYAFRFSYIYDHLDVAKWLWNLDGKINLSIIDDELEIVEEMMMTAKNLID